MAGDVYFANVKSLLLCNGANNSTTFTDSSNFARSTTVGGNAKLTTTSPKFGSACMTLDGSHDDVRTNGTDQALSGDFAIDVWYKTTSSTTYQPLVSSNDDPRSSVNWSFTFAGGTDLRFIHGSSSSLILNASGLTGANDGNWHHAALTRSGTDLRIYLDGVHKASATFSGTLGSTTAIPEWGYWRFQANALGGTFGTLNGQLDCCRMTDGVPRWTGTGSFTPPTTEADYLAPTGGPFPHFVRRGRGGLLIPAGGF